MAKYTAEPHGHAWVFDDRGGERTLPADGDCCLHCSQTWQAYSKSPQKCVPRPKFTPVAEVAPERKPEPFPGKSEDEHIVIGHRWPKYGEKMPKIGTPCLNCGVEYGNPVAVNTCTGQQHIEVPIKKRDPNPFSPPQVLEPQRVESRTPWLTDDEVWIRAACAALSKPGIDSMTAANEAESMLARFKKRFRQ